MSGPKTLDYLSLITSILILTTHIKIFFFFFLFPEEISLNLNLNLNSLHNPCRRSKGHELWVGSKSIINCVIIKDANAFEREEKKYEERMSKLH